MTGNEIDSGEMTAHEYRKILMEIEQQPAWRATADREMDYADGNQLDGDLLQKQRELGIPPAVENIITPTLLSLSGYEKRVRTDWRVTPNGQEGGKDVADALSFLLNQAERESKADAACSHAFLSQSAVGIGWVEVSRNQDPMQYKFRCRPVHRNEIHWDMQAREDDLSDARWIRRQKWVDPSVLSAMFPEHRDIILGSPIGMDELDGVEGGDSTGLINGGGDRAETYKEMHTNGTVRSICIVELWYRRWEDSTVLRFEDGRVSEYDELSIEHAEAILSGAATVHRALLARVRRSYWIGMNKLSDEPSPYPHTHFPYVPFWGFREDMTGVPYGYVRGMKFPQDNLNSCNSKLRWGLSAVRVETTKGATDLTLSQLTQMASRVDAVFVLNHEHMRHPGARFEVKRDYQLSQQHYQLMQDSRASIEKVSGITSAFQGRMGSASSGLQEQTQVEQSNQSIADMMDKFRQARTQVGELLLALIISDIGTKQHEVIVDGNAVRSDRTVTLNMPQPDPVTGNVVLSNAIQQVRLKVALDDVPSTNSYRAQQLNALSESIKSMPSEYQVAVLPFLVQLMDVPFKDDVIKAIQEVSSNNSPDAIEKRIKSEVDAALAKSGNEIRLMELKLKEQEIQSQIKLNEAKAVQTGVQASYSAMQAGAQIAQMPQIAPIADAVMAGAGYTDQGGQDPNFPTPAQSVAQPAEAAQTHPDEAVKSVDVRQNTSPSFPPVPRTADSGMGGIETQTPSDNMQSGIQ